jgi:hypothetical protein
MVFLLLPEDIQKRCVLAVGFENVKFFRPVML